MATFGGPRRKINRAKRHISDLNTAVGIFIERNPHVFITKRNAKTGQYSFTHDVPQMIVPGGWPEIIGDAVHNLRAALDYLACDVVRLNGGKTKDVYFPFSKNAASFEKAIKDKHINRAAPDVVNIFRSLKPYNGGDDLLRSLHDLDILDKHGREGLIKFWVDRNKATIAAGFGSIRTQWDNVTSVTTPEVIGEGYVEVGQQFKVPLEVVFGKGPLEGKAILPSLFQLTKSVERIIEIFEEHCFGTKSS